jgi:dienelactone hydrolase
METTKLGAAPGTPGAEQEVGLTAAGARLSATLAIPQRPRAIVLFAHGSGSSRHSPRNRYVAGVLGQAGLATLLLDLLTPGEEAVDAVTRQHRFDIDLLARRLVGATEWTAAQPATHGLAIGYFGASTGAAAALIGAAQLPGRVTAVVSRGGRPDLAGGALERVRTPVLLIVGGRDLPVIELNREALARIRAEKRLEIVPGATHLFEEPGALEQVAKLASGWFVRHLRPEVVAAGLPTS